MTLTLYYLSFVLALSCFFSVGLGVGVGIFVPKWQTVVPDTNVVIELTGSRSQWKLKSDDEKYIVEDPVVPSDLISNLIDAGIVDNPYINRNFLSQRHVWMGDHAIDEDRYANRTRTWIYSTTFEIPKYEKNSDKWSWTLVLEGVKMGARILLDDQEVSIVANQFLRHEVQLSKLQSSRSYKLSVVFDPKVATYGRFSACSGGWDWAPYVRSLDIQGKRVFTLGIVKPIYLVATEQCSIGYVVPKIYYHGEYLKDEPPSGSGTFELQVTIHLYRATSSERRLPQKLKVIVGDEIRLISIPEPKTIITTTMIFSDDSVDLWWPAGMGNQALYDLFVGFHDAENDSKMIHKRIAFRTAALVTIDESDPEQLDAALADDKGEGSGSHGLYFRINGAVLLARGSNFIPMDQLEGRLSDEAHIIAVRSAFEAGMNMLRVWGGGMILPDAFYDECDEKGILLYHDLMFVDFAGHGPQPHLDTGATEVAHIVRSLSTHPSIVLWNACNECEVIMNTPTEIYATFVMRIVADEDNSRAIWPSSPSPHGWKTGVYTIDGRPNGMPLSVWDPSSFPNEIETHGPYLRGFSGQFPGVNGYDVNATYNNTPPAISQDPIGIQFSNVFSSEFGASVWSSAESMMGTLDRTFWSLHGNSNPDICTPINGAENYCIGNNVMAERNYPCDTHILAYFGNATSFNETGQRAFEEQMYHCLMAQTLWMKGEIESRRSTNSYGLLIWQLNENWPTGGWGCIEYGTVSGTAEIDEPQVEGGRWKPLINLLKSALFQNVMAACGKDGICYIRNDSQEDKSLLVAFEAWRCGKKDPSFIMRRSLTIRRGQIYRILLPRRFTDRSDALIIDITDVQTQDDHPSIQTTALSSHPKDMQGLKIPVKIFIESFRLVGKDAIEFAVTANNLALFVVLTCKAQGKFSDNAFSLRPNDSKTVVFTSMRQGEAIDLDAFMNSLRIEHLGFYLVDTQEPKLTNTQ